MGFAFPLTLNESLSDQLWVNYTLWESCENTPSYQSWHVKQKKPKALVHKACLYTYKLPACRNLLRDIDCAATLNSPCHCESHHLPRQLGTKYLQGSMEGQFRQSLDWNAVFLFYMWENTQFTFQMKATPAGLKLSCSLNKINAVEKVTLCAKEVTNKNLNNQLMLPAKGCPKPCTRLSDIVVHGSSALHRPGVWLLSYETGSH